MADVERLLASGSNIPLRLLIARTKPVAAHLIAESNAAALDCLLDRIACVCSLGLALDIGWLFDDGLAGLWSVYEAGHDRFARTSSDGLPAQAVWLAVARRIVALGAYGIRAERWSSIRALALRPGEANQPATLNRTWIRYALTQAARAGLLTRIENGREVPVSIIRLAVEDSERLACLRPDQAADSEAILNSACQFDAAAGLAVMATGGRLGNIYPSFGAFHEYRTEPILIRLIDDADARAAIAPMTDAELAEGMRWLDAAAREQFFGQWDRYYDERIQRFLERNPPSTEDRTG
jgi:hypothetical protein